MRISFVLPPVAFSGGIRVLSIYADALRRRGHRVLVVSPPVRQPPLLKTMVRWARGRGWTRPPRKLRSYFDGLPVEHKVLERHRPVVDADLPEADIVLATWWETAPWVAALSPSKGAKAYFVQDYGAVGQPLEKLVETWRLPMHLFTISGFLQDLVREHTGRAIESIGNGVDLAHYATPPRERNGTPIVGMVYRPLPEKGCGLALEAVELARQRVPNLTLKGFGTRRPEPMPDAVRRGDFGWGLDDSKLPAIYAACDAWIMPSQREGYGLPILEAMASRTPVIATPAGAARELIEPGGGMVVPHGDAAAMADAIVRIVTLPPERWRAMSDAALATAGQYDWEKAIDRFEAAVSKAMTVAARA